MSCFQLTVQLTNVNQAVPLILIGCRLARGGATAPGGGATELMHRITLTLLLLLLLTNDEGQDGQRVERERYSDRKSEKEG